MATSGYNKGDGTRVPKSLAKVSEASIEEVVESTEALELEVYKDYTKEEGTLDPTVVYILSGGEEREKKYFYFLTQEKNRELPVYKKNKVQLLFLSNNEMVPSRMHATIKEALEEETIVDNHGTSHTIISLDRIFLLSDVDEFYDQLKVALSDCTDDRYEWIISNPSIELWLYLCHITAIQPFVDLADVANEPVATRSQLLKNQLGKLVSGGADPRKAHLKCEQAIQYMLEHYKEDAHGIPELFSTQMHRLAQCLNEILEG